MNARLYYRSIHYKASGMIVSISLTRLILAVNRNDLSINLYMYANTMRNDREGGNNVYFVLELYFS